MYRIGIDIGGTNIRAALFDENMTLIEKNYVATNSYKDVKETVEGLFKTVQTILDNNKVSGELKGIGIGAPGPLDPFKGIILSPPNLPGWEDIPLKKLFENRFKVPVHLHNDANAAAVAEYVLSYRKQVQNLIYVTVSTGVGTGVIADNRLLLGHNGNAAEFGHTIVRPGGILCGCGNRGCLEAQASGTGMVKRLKEVLAQSGEPSVLRDKKTAFTSKDILEAAGDGDELAKAIVKDVQEDLALGIANLVHAYNPQKIIFGGGVMQAGDVFIGPAMEKAYGMIMSGMKEDLEMKTTSFGPDLGLYGAASLVDFYQSS